MSAPWTPPPSPPDQSDHRGKSTITKFTIGKILPGHFWWTNFWVPDAPSPSHTSLPPPPPHESRLGPPPRHMPSRPPPPPPAIPGPPRRPERILDRIEYSARELRQRRDDRVSWELSQTPPAMWLTLLVLNSLFYVDYLVLTTNLTWPGYRVFFGAITGAVALLYLVVLDLGDIYRGTFTVNSGMKGPRGTAPIMKPIIDTVETFLDDARRECARRGLPLKSDGGPTQPPGAGLR